MSFLLRKNHLKEGVHLTQLAICGGLPVRSKGFPTWPVHDERELQMVTAVLQSGQWWFGEKVAEFQARFAAYHHAQHGIAVTSGTTALEVALRAVGVQPGDEVIVPPYTFIATASAALLIGAVPVFADIHPNTLCLDPSSVRSVVTNRTKAIVPVHIAGLPADMDAMLSIAAEHDLAVVEDAAQAHGAEWKGRRVGALGNAGIFSFQASKNMSAGEGGIVVTNDQRVADLCYAYHHVGRLRDSAWYDHPVLGWNYRMTEMQAALLLAQLQRLDEQTNKRHANALYLAEQLRQIEGLRPIQIDSRATRGAWHLFPIRYEPAAFAGISKGALVAALQAEGIPAGVGYSQPLYAQPVLQSIASTAPAAVKAYGKELSYEDIGLPVTEKATATVIWLTQNVLLAERDDMDDIAQAFAKLRRHATELAQRVG